LGQNEPSLEKKVVAASIRSKGAFNRIEAASTFDDYTPYGSYCLKLVKRFYERDPEASKVDRDVLLEWVKADIPDKNQPLYSDFIKECCAIDVSSTNIADLVVDTKRRNISNRLAAALLDRKDQPKILELMNSYTSLEEAEEAEEEENFSEVSIEDMLRQEAEGAGLRIKLLPKQLDEICKGKTKRGHHIVVFARPETGKTCLTLTMAFGFALQGLDVIIFGNEEPVQDTILRAQCCFTGMTEEEIKANPARAQALLDKRGWKHLRFIPLSPGSPKQIDKYVERYKPDVVIVDQIRNLNVGAETRVNQLEMAATSMRNIGKRRNCLMISVTQAGDSANNKLVLDMGDIDFSNTGIPATADLMVGMGVNAEKEAQGLRVFNTPKNKIGGRHQHFQCLIKQQISRLEDL